MKFCGICGCLLNRENDLSTADCGGDRLRCMAEAGDPDCIAAMARLTGHKPLSTVACDAGKEQNGCEP